LTDAHDEHPAHEDGEVRTIGAYLLDPSAEPDDIAPTDADAPAAHRRVPVRGVVMVALLAALASMALVFGPTTLQILRERSATINRPDEIVGLQLDTSQGAQDTAEYLRAAVSAGVPLDKTVGAVYVGNEDTTHSVIFFGGTGLLLQPEKELRQAFGLITDQTGGVVDVKVEPAGNFGGVLKCGTTATDDGTMPVCGWADHGSLAIALFPGRGVDESAALMLRMRDGMQHRG
jgi:hypothetical protein